MKKTLHSFKFTKKINKAFYLLLFLLFSTIGFAQTITPTKIVTVAPGVCGALDVELKIQGSNPVARPLEVVLVIDVSGSMGDGNNPKPLSRAQDAAIDFINKMFLPANNTTNKNRVAIVTYSTTASIRRNLTLASGQADLISVINGLSANGSTNIQDGLVKAKTVLDGATYDCATARSIVLLTDGVANATGTNGASCSDGQQGTCIQSAITAATAAKTVTVSGTSYNNQIFSVGLFGAISGTEQTNAQYALNQIQSGGSFFTENAADLTGIYGQIFTQLSWVAKQIPSTAFEKETVDSNFTIGTVTPSKGTVTIVGQQINWNIDFLNVETITLKYRLTPKPNTCGNQLVSTSRLDFQNAACVTTFQNITSPTTNVPCPIITLASQTNVTCFGGNNGAITLNTPTGGQAPYTYKWTKNNVDFATTKDLTNLSFGTYRVIATDSNGCATGILTVEITQPSAALALAASSRTNVICFGASTGTVTAGAVTNSVGTVTYTWKNASNVTVGTTASVSNLPAGTYTLTVTDSCSSQTNSVTITQPSAALALAASSKTDISCFGASTGTVTAGTITNSVGTVNYTWKNASNVTVGTTASVSNLPAGTYTLTVTDSCSSQTNSVTITQPSAALALAASSKTDVTCYSASTGTVTAGAVTNSVGTVTYTWKNASNVTVGTTASVSNLPAGTYTLTVTDSCSSQTNSVTITQPSAALALAASSKTDVTCFSASTGTVTAGAVTNSVGTVTYTWKNASNVTVGTAASVSNLPAGTYTLTVTDNCSSQSNSVTITQPSAALALGAPSKTDVTCYNASTGTVTAGAVTNSVGTVTYSWTNSLNAVVGNTASVSNLPAGTYTLTVSDNCSSRSNSVTINQPSAALALSASSKTDVTCYSASTGTVTAGAVTNSVGTVTYSWTNSLNAVVGNTASVSNLPAGTYTLTVSDNCSSQSNSVTIMQPSAALALAASSKTDVTCYSASTGTVTAGTVTNSVGTVTYSWTNSSNAVVGNTASVSNLPAGTYTLTVSDNCSSQSNSVTITQPSAALALAPSSKTDVICFGASTGIVTAGSVTNSVGTVTYSWTNSSNAVVGNTASVSNLPTGTYTLTVSDNCSSRSNSVTINQPSAALALSASSKIDVSCFGESTGSLTAGTVTNAVGTVIYNWTNSSNVSVGNTASVSNLPAGTYTLTVTDNCSSQSNSVTISQPGAVLTCSITQNKAVTANGLSNGEATVTPIGGNGNYTYLWDNNETTQKAVGLNAGLHTVTVTDEKGCTTTCSITITEPNVLSCSITQDSAVKCFGESNGQATVTAIGGNGDYTYLWDNNETTAQAVSLNAGLHTVTVIDKLGYTTTCTVTITQPQEALSATTTQVDVVCGGGNTGSATVFASGGTSPYTYSWNTNPAQTSATATTLAAGNYSVIVTDANLCTVTKSVTIIDGDSVKPIIDPLPEISTINCPSEPFFAQATATDNIGTIASLTYEDAIVPGNCTGSYTKTRTWTATDSCGNVSLPVSQTIIVQDITAPTWTTQTGSLNQTIECSNAEALTSAQALFPTASDSCDTDVSNITKISGQFAASEGCANSGTYTNTWTVRDDCGNTSDIFTQVITIQDTTAPTWTTQAGSLNQTIECSNAEALTSAQALFPTASDLCDADVSNITKVSGQFTASEGCSNAGTYTNTWTVKDDCGNTSDTFTQIITIQDTTAPTWTTQAGSLNQTIECSNTEALTSAQTLFPTASDSCDADVSNINKVSGQFVASEGCANSGTYTNTWTVKDDCGNTSDTFTQVITIQDTTSPTWTTQSGSLNLTIECSNQEALTSAQALFPTASDLCDIDVSNITKVSGQFTASEGCANAGTYTNTWTVKDDCGNTSDTFTQVITIQDTTSPTWTTQSGSLNLTIECSNQEALTSAQALFPTASDLCDVDVSNITKVSGQFIASEGCANSGTYTNSWIAKDDCGNTSDTFTQIITIQDTTAPTWTTQAGSLNQTIECSNAEALTSAQALFPTASDLCDVDVSNITKVSGQFTATEGCANSGTYTNTWTVKDDCGNTSDTFTQVITIQDTTAPTWTTQTSSLNQTIECSNAEALTSAQALFPTASDSCDLDVSNITKVSGQFIASEGCANSGTYTNSWIAKDDCGNTSDTFTQIITIQDTTAPTWTTQAGSLNQTIECSNTEALTSAQTLFPTASDSCDADVSNITKVSGQFVASEECGNSGTYTNTWTVKDDCGNTSDTFTQVITIQDTTAPTWTTQSGSLDVTLQCADTEGFNNAQTQVPIATDNCNGTVTYTKTTGELQRGSCGSTGTYTNTWTAKDSCNNTSAIFTQVITIQDTAAPTWITQAGTLNVTLQCSDAAGLENAQNQAPTATANCTVVTYEKTSGQFSASEGCANSGTYTNTWTVKDDCGNTSDTFTQIITIQDTTAPTWATQTGSLNQTIECSNAEALTSAQALFPTASDLCDSDVSNITKISGQFVASEGCSNAGTYTNTWTVKDDCGNTSDTFTQIITIQDTTAPTWTTQSGSLDVTLQCADTEGFNNAQTQAPIATDNCNGTVTYTKTTGELQRGSCGSTGTYTNTWTAKDSCNNTSTIFTQVITIQDTAAPTWITQAGTLNVTLQCSDAAGLENAQNQAPTATANCTVVTYEKTSGQFSASEGCTNSGTYTNSWIAKDDCGNVTDSFIQIITIQDTTAPTWATQASSLNQTIECSNAEALTSAQTLFPSASDLCDADVSNITKVSGQFIASEGCANSGTYINTWTVKDDCGNTSDTFTQIITIQDTTAPTWTTQTGSLNQTIECSNVEALTSAQALFPTASDSCDTDVSNITKVSGQFIASEGCANSGTYTNTWTVKDDCGNTSDTFTQIITIQDTTAPTWTTQTGSLNQTIECSNPEALTSVQAIFPTASDLCDTDVSNITKVSGQFVASEGCSNSGTYTNTWTVKDDCGNTSDTFTQIITIQDTTAPTWTTESGSLNKTIECSNQEALTSAQALFPTASDLCDTDVSNITKISGQFIASEGCSNSGTYTNTWTVKDDCGNISDTFTQVITIQDTTAPTWTTQTGSLNQTVECNNQEALTSAQALFPTASDLCDADVSNITKVSGQFVASEGCANAGTYTNTWTVKDDCGNTSDTFTQIITIQDTTAPTWTTQSGSLNQTIECSNQEALTSAQALFPTASDLCDADVSNITKVSGQFIASEGCANSGTYTHTWTVKDDCGNTSDTFTQIITIQDTTAPTWTTQSGSLNQTIECSNAEALTSAQALFPTASDLCDADVSNITKVSGQFIASEGCANSGTYINTWTVKDDCGNTSDTFTQIITIQDTTAPTWTTQTGSLNQTIECSNAEALTSAQALFPSASDLCDTDVSNITKVSGQFTASEGCSNSGTYTNTWTVKDDCGNTSDTFTQIITIQDTTPPIFTGNLPTDITVSCDAVPEPANLEASDNCSGDLPIVFSEIKSNVLNECGTDYTLTRKWTTSDCGGNTVSHTQIITVRDTTPPTGTAPADVTDLQSIIDIPAPNPQVIIDAADNCSSTVTITISDSNNGGSGCNGNAYILTRTYTLTDCSGNKTELVQTFTVENKVSVTGIATNVTCFGKNDGSILVTNSPGSTVVITNDQNEVVGNTNLPAGTYTLTATSAVNGENQTCTATATVVITQPEYSTKISGYVMNVDNNSGIANVMVTLIPQGTTTGPILLRITGTNGGYSFTGMSAGNYLVQVQDATLNSVYQLYPTDSSLFFTVLEDCTFQEHTFNYGSSTLPVLGDYVWYDVNSNGIQDEWYDANNDGVVTKNVPDSGGGIDYSLWEWIDFNGDGSYQGPSNVGELNAGGFGNAASPNVIIDGPNGYHKEVIIGIEGYWRDRPNTENPYGQYTIKLVKDGNLDAMAAALGATGLVKVLPNLADKKATAKTGKIQMHTVCSTTSPNSYIVNVTPQDLVHLDNDFGINCKEYRDIVANDDSAGPLAGVNHTTTNVLNVLVNDTLEGNAVTVSDVIITTVTPNEFLQLNPDGSVDVLPNAPVGTLTLVYQICEADQTSNCDTATVTITIVAPVMTVTATPICVNDVPYIDYVVTPGNFTPVNGVTIAWANAQNIVITTMTDLPLSGRVLWPGAVVNEAGNGIDWPGWIFENNKWVQGADGFESLRPTVNLTISVNPSETITVNYPPADPYCIARPTFAIVANDDNPPAITAPAGVTNIVNVYNNDTLNNDPVNPADVTLTTVTPDPTNTITLNPDGTVDVAPNSPAGTYTLTYQICENADAGNCDTAIVTVIIVEPAPPTPIVANDDVYANIGCNTFGLVGNVLSNDFKGQLPATLELVNFTLLAENENNAKTDPNITIDNQGNVTVSSLTPAGTYTYNYRICDKLSAENCDTATVTITVVPNGIVNITSESCNDDSSLINLSNLLPEGTPIIGTWIDTNETNALQGNIFNPFGLALGNYLFEYKITDENCPRSILLNMEVNNDCHVLACGNIVIHNAFSPNGDGINDVFVIDSINDITCYPENTVEIYNRWGILIFETSNYNNTTNAFDGTSRGRTTVNKSDGLPSGTYFYILTYKSLNGNNEIQNNKEDGYLYLSK